MKISQKWQVLIIISLGIFMSTLDGSIVNIANPTIANDFNVSINSIQWIVTTYMLVITATLMFFGRLGDKIGGQIIYTWGFLLFSIGSIFCSLSTSLTFLVIARIIQAFGASMMMATGMGIISNTFPPHEKGKALGLTGTVVGIGNMSGPAIGGALIAHFPWPIIFWINVPIGIIAFFVSLKYLPTQPRNDEIKRFDIPGILLFSIFTTFLLLSLSNSENFNLIWISISILIFIIFYFWERRTEQSMLDFELFKIKRFSFGNLMAFSAYSAQMSVLFLMPFYLENIMQISPAASGIIMTITPISMALTAPLAGSLSDKIGSYKILLTSFSLMALSYTVLALIKVDTSPLQLYVGLALLGIGMGAFGSPNNSDILSSIPPQKAGYGGGFGATVRNFAFALGIALSSTIFTWYLNLKKNIMSYNLAYTTANSIVYKIAIIVALLGLAMAFFVKQYNKKEQTFDL